METYSMLPTGEQPPNTMPENQPAVQGLRNRRKTNWLRLGMGCLLIAFFATLVAVAIVKGMPNIGKTADKIEKKGGEVEETPPITEKPVARPMGPKMARNNLVNSAARSIALKSSRCSLCINKLGLVQLTGEYGSRIQDDIRTYITSTDAQYLTATVYEDVIYRLHVQLDCGATFDRDSSDSPCSHSLSVTVWVDFNDNEFDDNESRLLLRSWSNTDTPTGAYDVDLRIPTIDGRYTKSGVHTMRLTVAPSEEYQRECGVVAYQQQRDYTINVVPKMKPIVVTAAPYIYRNPICSVNFAKIILVLMTAEKGTHIRDDIPRNALVSNLPNQHHIGATLFENTMYLIRIQLDCSTQLSTELTTTGCNLAQDVIVSIDQNDDGRFDESETGSPYRWPVSSYMAHGIYDLQIYVPLIGDRYLKTGSHRMRILVLPSDYYIRNCGYTGYNETREYNVNIIPVTRRGALTDVSTPYILSKDVECSSDVGKIVLIVMAGEYRTQIRDDSSTRAAINHDNRYQQHSTIILYEDTVYLLRIQLECNQQRGSDFFKVNCTLPHDVNAWIDLNDDGQFSDSENAAPYRWPLASYVPEGIYDLQIYVPVIDGRKIKTGPHRMRLVVTLNEQYRQKCGNNYYRENRDYNVTIVRYTTQPIETGVPYLALSDNACSQTNAKIVLVIMTGELGTHIRDDTPLNTVIKDNQNRHHMGVTLYENTVYRIRIQLDCDQPSSRGLYDENCNLRQDVSAFIDISNNGIYNEAESRIQRRWPLHTSTGLGIYDLTIPIPIASGTHRLRVVVMPSDEYNTKCGQTNYKEVREYSVNIIPRTTYGELRGTHCSTGNLACSDGNSAIFSVKLFGEENTNIDDQTKQCSSTNNYHDQRNLLATLYDNTVYTLTVELFCVQQWGYANSYNRDPSLFRTVCDRPHFVDAWIDFNNDGVFDQSKERMTYTNRYRDDNNNAQYDLRINIPRIDGRNYLDGQHRMRVILTQGEQTRQPCYNSGIGEARDYTVQIIRNPTIKI